MLIVKHLFIPVIRCAARVEQETRGVNQRDFVRNFSRFVDEQIVNRLCIVAIVARVVKVLVVRRISNHKIKLHCSSPRVHPTILQPTLPPPVIDADGQCVLSACRKKAELLDLLGQLKERELHRLMFCRHTGNRPANPVHLPEIPDNRPHNRTVFALRRFAPPSCTQIFLECHEEIYPRDQQVISLELVAVCRLIGTQRPLHPCRFIDSVLRHHTQLTVKDALPLRERNALHCRNIIALYEIRCLATGDLKPSRINIVLPFLPLRKTDALRRNTILHKRIMPTEVQSIRLCNHPAANVERGEHLRMAACPLRLLFHLLTCTCLDHIRVFSRDKCGSDFLRLLVGIAECTVGICRPEDISLCRLICQQRSKQALRIQPQNFILYSDEQQQSLPSQQFTILFYHSRNCFRTQKIRISALRSNPDLYYIHFLTPKLFERFFMVGHKFHCPDILSCRIVHSLVMHSDGTFADISVNRHMVTLF